jgi:hypothetical protein
MARRAVGLELWAGWVRPRIERLYRDSTTVYFGAGRLWWTHRRKRPTTRPRGRLMPPRSVPGGWCPGGAVYDDPAFNPPTEPEPE